MTAVFGRCDTGTSPTKSSRDGTRVTFEGWILGTSVNDLKARCQQAGGLVNNLDEPIIPCTFTHDSTFDGFYSVSSVNVSPVEGAGYVGSPRVQYSITLEQMPGFANPMFEVITQSVVQTNSHAITAPPSVAFYLNGDTPGSEYDLRGTALTVQITRPNADGAATINSYVYTGAAPIAVTQTRAFYPPAYFYYGSARVEVKYGSTWYPAVGRNIPLNSVWRISNGMVRLTSATGATAGTLEVWDQTAAAGVGAWESQNVAHWTNGAVGPGIGLGNGSLQATVSILRNSPEQVTVRCGGLSQEFTYTVQRGNMHVAAAWTSATATKYGAGYTTANATTTITAGIRRTSNDANGHRLVFGMPVLQTVDNVNGGTNAATAATSGRIMLGVELAGSSAISGNAAADIVNQFMGATSWRQRVVPR